jgi:acyl-CoA thioesterase-1
MPKHQAPARRLATLTAAALLLCGGRAAAQRVSCIGDSITAGSGLPASSAYPALLPSLLSPGAAVGNFGQTRKTMIKAAVPLEDSYWQGPLLGQAEAFRPDRVVIMLGTNDSKAPTWRNGANAFEADYAAMIAELARLPTGPRLYAVLPPPALHANFGIDPAVIEQQIVPAIRRVAAATGVTLIDVRGAFAGAPERYFGAGDGADLGDGVHPNAAGARLIAETVARALTAAPPDAAAIPPAPDAAAPDVPAPSDAAPALDAASGPPIVGRPPTDAATAPAGHGGCQAVPGTPGGGWWWLLPALARVLRRRL